MTERTDEQRYQYLRSFNQQAAGAPWNFLLELILFGVWAPEELDAAIDAAIAAQEGPGC